MIILTVRVISMVLRLDHDFNITLLTFNINYLLETN